MGPFCFWGVLDEDEDCCSTKRASVLDARSAPAGSKQTQGCFDQSLRARQKMKGPFMGPFCSCDPREFELCDLHGAAAYLQASGRYRGLIVPVLAQDQLTLPSLLTPVSATVSSTMSACASIPYQITMTFSATTTCRV